MIAGYDNYASRAEAWIAAHRDEFVRNLIELVNIRSVSVEGEGGYAMGTGCARVLDRALDMARAWGLETENDDYFCGSAMLKGETDREVAFVGHLDVVPEGEGWTYEPFSAVYEQGHVIGRGAADNKGACLAALYAARCLSELGAPLKYTVRVLMGCQEETGPMKDMLHFRSVHKDPDLCLVVDCPFPIHHGEKGKYTGCLRGDISGGNIISFDDGGSRSAVPAFAKMVISGHSLEKVREALRYESGVEDIFEQSGGVAITAKGVAGHPGFPEKDGSVNAIQKLADIMARSELLNGACRPAVSFLAEAFSDWRGTGLGIAYSDELCGPTMVVQLSVEKQGDALVSDFMSRFAIHEDEKWMFSAIERAAAEHGFSFERLSYTAPWYVPLNAMGGLPQKLTDIAVELLGLGPLEPVILPAGTHAHMLKNALGYGATFSPEVGFGRPKFGFPHGADESVSIDLLMSALRVYVLTLMRIDDEI